MNGKNIWPLAAFAALILYLSPGLFLGGGAVVRIHDNLDGFVADRFAVARSGKMFGAPIDASVDQVMTGIPLNSFLGSFNVTALLFDRFSVGAAYVFNDALVHVVGFAGMFLLVSSLLEGAGQNIPVRLIASLVALSFSLLPFYSMAGVSASGQPLFLYALIDAGRRGFSWRSALCVCAFVFHSSVVYTFGMIFAAALYSVFTAFERKKPRAASILAVSFMAMTLAIAVEYRMVYQTFFDRGYISHRTEFDATRWSIGPAGLPGALAEMILTGQYHAPSFNLVIILTLALAALVVRVKLADELPHQRKYMKYSLYSIFALTLFYGAYNSWLSAPFRNAFSITRSFQFDRIYFSGPMLWHVAMGMGTAVISTMRETALPQGRKIAAALLICHALFTMSHDAMRMADFPRALDAIFNKGPVDPNISTIDNFMAAGLFGDIKEHVGRPCGDYRVASVGIEPAVSILNGFYSLDGFAVNYPLDYKRKFRRVIAGELARDDFKRDYFDKWGNRCYVAAPEKSREIELRIDTNALSDLAGGRDVYIFSWPKLLNYNELGLRFLKKFSGGCYDVHLYLFPRPRAR